MATSFVLLSVVGGVLGAVILAGLGSGGATILVAYCLSGLLAAGSLCLAAAYKVART